MAGKGHFGSFLRLLQALLYLVTVASGITCCICMGWTSKILSNQCILYASTVFTRTTNNTLVLDIEQTSWGTEIMCSYCTFTAVVAVIYAIIWFWFYILMSEWKGSVTQHYFIQHEDGPPPDMKLMIPTLVCNIIMFICVCVSTGLIRAGCKSWCESVEKNFPEEPSGCQIAKTLSWSIPNGSKVYTFLAEANTASIVLLTALGLKILLVSIRLRRYVNSVQKLEKKEELEDSLIDTPLNTISEEEDSDSSSDSYILDMKKARH